MTPAPFKFPLSVSYDSLTGLTPKQLDKILSDDRIELLVRAEGCVEFASYLAFLKVHHAQLYGYLTLNANLDALVAEGLHPIPVHHYGEGEAMMDALYKRASCVALGGLRRPHRGTAPKSYVVKKMEWAKGRNVHWLSYCPAPMIAALKPHSCDAVRSTGRMDIYTGAGNFISFDFRTMHEKRLWLAPILRRAVQRYGCSVEGLLNEKHWKLGNPEEGLKLKDCALFRLPTLSWLDYALTVRRNFGTRLFLTVQPAQFPAVVNCIDYLESINANTATEIA